MQCHIPAPRLDAIDVETRELRLVDKPSWCSTYPCPEPSIGPSRLFHIFHQHTVVGASPQRRQVAEIGSQPPAGMGGGKIAQARSQGKVVFGIEYE
jgi:hypothetical protein